MGNDNGRSHSNNHFNVEDWVQLSDEHDSDNQNEHGHFLTYQHKVTQQQIDKYDLVFVSEEDGDNYYQCFLQRLRQDNIVNTVQFKTHYVKEFCSTTYLAEVYIQHIPVRLSDITDIPFPQNIYILKCCLQGFQQLYRSVGFFQVRDDHICIDKYGVVRVWMNSDLSKNYPDQQKFIEVISQTQSTMVKRIFQIIENNTDKGQQPLTLEQYFNSKNKKYPIFQEALEMVEEYIEEYKITVPDYCESILQIFEENPDEKVTEKDIIKENFQHLQSEVNHNFHPENLHIENYRHENLITDSFNTYNELGIHPENPSAKFIPILPNNINNINQIHQNQNRPKLSQYHPAQQRISQQPNIIQHKIFHNQPQIQQPIFEPNFKKNIMKISHDPSLIHTERPHSNILKPNSHRPAVNFNYKPIRPISNENHQVVNVQENQIQQINQIPNQNTVEQNNIQNHHQHKELSESEKKIVENVLSSLNIQLPEHHLKESEGSMWSYNVTGDSTQELDPQIARDLLKYL